LSDHHHDTDPALDEEFWNERYRSSARIWSGKPNPQLVAEVESLPPGRALDVGCGEGADALWLAERGWSVVATDISSVALERAARHTPNTGPAVSARIEWRHVDLLSKPPELDSFDLVSAQFMQLPPEPRGRLFTALAAAVKVEGALLVVGHHPSHATAGAHVPPQPDRFYTAEGIAGLLDDSWTVVVNEARLRMVTNPDGDEVSRLDSVLLAVRHRAARPARQLRSAHP
jgi:SAM-dependent methyltransferase